MSRDGLAKDRAPGARTGAARPVALAIVQHGHQCLITDGYENREGISEVLEGFTTVLALHLKHRIPLSLHLSGTLIEAIAWHYPSFFDWIRALRRHHLLEIIGSTYSQNIMTLFSGECDLRQLNEALRLYRVHLGVEPEEVRGFWVPERVWNTEKLAPLLRSPQLLNRGYQYVLLDDRLTYPCDGRYESSERQRFDLNTAPCLGRAGEGSGCHRLSAFGDGAHLRPYRIQGGGGLVAVPVAVELRYCVPPRYSGHWVRLEEALGLTAAGAGAIAVYGDDLEKTASVGPWASGRWEREGVTPYEGFLAWIAEQPGVEPVLISSWLRHHPPQVSRVVDPGTFFELAIPMGAGEDYLGWWQADAWQPYRKLLTEAEALLRRAAPGPRPGLWDLAWKQLMACSYETAWHTVEADGACRPAPWAKAAAAHAGSVFVVAAAAEWLERRDGRAHVRRLDLDRDGREEVILLNDYLYAVLTPHYGGRLVYLFDLARAGGRLVVGNPADDWNWQEELNRFMEVPRNHPGAFADVGHENDRYAVELLGSNECGAEVRLVNVEAGCLLAGATKMFRLGARSRVLEAAYRLPAEPERFGVEFCLSPDYLALLREGRRAIRPVDRGSAHGWRTGSTAVWVDRGHAEPLVWDWPKQAECGHGMMLRVAAYRREFRLQIGAGLPTPPVGEGRDDEAPEMARMVPASRSRLHRERWA